MKTRTTLLFLGIVLGLGLWIKFYESKRPNTEEAQRQSRLVLNLDREKLDGLEIQNGEDTIQLRRENGKWRLNGAVKDQADAAVVDHLISDLESWEKDQTIPGKEMDADKNALAEFDLVKPKLRLTLHGPGQEREILFGKDAALENRMYIRFANSHDALVVRQTVENDITKKPEDFRDRKLTEISAAQGTRVILKTPAGEMEIDKKNDAWEIGKPLRARADNQKMGDLIAQVTSARIVQFVGDDHGDLQRYGLAQPRGAITLFTADEKDGRTLQIGTAPEKEKDQVYVRYSARNFVYTLPNKIEGVLKMTPAELRDKHLVRIDQDVLDRITIDAPGKSKVVLARKGEDWTSANADNQPANKDEVTRLLSVLQGAEVKRFVEDVASDLPKYGLDQPQLKLTFSSFASENTAESKAGEEPFATLAFGRQDGEEVYARVGEEPFIVTVPRGLLDQIFTDPVQWQSLAIFQFKPDKVHRLAVTTTREIKLARGPKDEWTAEGKEPINAPQVDALLNTLTKLHAVRWLGGSIPPQVFEKPQVTIDFTTSADDKTTHKLVVGGPAGGGMWYARVEGQTGVFLLSNPDFNALHEPIMPEAPLTPNPASSPSPATSPAP